MIKFSKFGYKVTVNKSFVDQSGCLEMKAPISFKLATDKRKVLDWYLVISQEKDNKGISEFTVVKGGALQFKARYFVQKFLEDFEKDKPSIDVGISSTPILINETTKAFPIITRAINP